VRVDVPAGLMVRAARVDNRPIPIVQTPSPHVLLFKPPCAIPNGGVISSCWRWNSRTPRDRSRRTRRFRRSPRAA